MAEEDPVNLVHITQEEQDRVNTVQFAVVDAIASLGKPMDLWALRAVAMVLVANSYLLGYDVLSLIEEAAINAARIATSDPNNVKKVLMRKPS